MSPAQSAMVMRKLETMEAELKAVKGQLRAERAAHNDLHETVDMQALRIEGLGEWNNNLLKSLEQSSQMIEQLIRKARNG